MRLAMPPSLAAPLPVNPAAIATDPTIVVESRTANNPQYWVGADGKDAGVVTSET
jgi:hypothetical protein